MPDDAEFPAANSPEPTSPGKDSSDRGERGELEAPDGDRAASEQEEAAEASTGEQDPRREPAESPDMGERLLARHRPRDADGLIIQLIDSAGASREPFTSTGASPLPETLHRRRSHRSGRCRR
jgi:hypothetical protein